MHVDKTEGFTIPDKCRKIGNPEGTYILYIEDYAHTFMKQNLQRYKQTVEFNLYGRIYFSDNVYYIFVQAISEKNNGEATYFSQESYLGTAAITPRRKDKPDNKWTIKCNLTENMEFVVESYYIYYEKNEMMQNYLIQWHEQIEKREPYEENEIKMKYARAIQNQYHNLRDGSYQKRIYSGICLVFCILFMVMTITVMNSYQKMNKLQSDIDFLVDNFNAIDTKNAIETLQQKIYSPQDSKIVSETIDVTQIETESESEEETLTEEQTTQEDLSENIQNEENTKNLDADQNVETVKNLKINQNGENTKNLETNQNVENIIDSEKDTQNSENVEVDSDNNIENDDKETAENSEINKQDEGETQETYIVKKGDTLQGILYHKYGSLSNIENVCTLNQLENPDDIKEGEKLYLP